ncbi:ABC transporter ATP-binding protein [Thermovenabulum gondwanense]|uniref:Sulfate/thiosulfate import ATP-binding protein CysA n=1 Tax=Thermovenabulum gondwanense TaxID=520767 RepID=A0A162MCL5_9FIRM|nr:ABC transporter ATP-binding protein [Thermovenabulum gondwanense]KYO65259.1 Sulfate/thiosulfate import ATP-binding protein CysA [Thermovenabulum gondwanense]
MSQVLEINSLVKRFGGVCAIDNFNIDIKKGSIHGLIGPNGAGKTTIFNLITGIYKPDSGKVLFNNEDITGKKPYEIANLGIGRTFQNIRLFSQLSVLENVLIAAHKDANYNLLTAVTHFGHFKSKEKHIRETCLELLNIVGLGDRLVEKAGNLPYGHQRKLEIARALALKPKLLLLDEPAAGMNKEESKELVGFIKYVYEKFDLTILMIEHHMDVVMSICDEITVLNFGKTIAKGTPKEIQKDKQVIEAYLGGENKSC